MKMGKGILPAILMCCFSGDACARKPSLPSLHHEIRQAFKTQKELVHLSNIQKDFWDKWLQFVGVEPTQYNHLKLHKRLTELRNELKLWHDIYGSELLPNGRHWYDSTLSSYVELELKKMSLFMEIAFSWNDGNRQKAVQLLIDSGELAPKNKKALQLLIDSGAFSSADHEVEVTDLVSLVAP